jgi:AMP-polyphosphate phosphotransferase
LRRFESRRDDPLRRWKLTDEDWRNRGKRSEYVPAVEEMLKRTDLARARWTVVPAESKHYARVKVIETVVKEFEHGMTKAGLTVPSAEEAEHLQRDG